MQKYLILYMPSITIYLKDAVYAKLIQVPKDQRNKLCADAIANILKEGKSGA